MNEIQTSDLSFAFTYFVYLYYFAWGILGIIGSVWVYRDAKKLPVLFLNSKPIWWALATVTLGAIWVVLVYWLIHHSTISNRTSSEKT